MPQDKSVPYKDSKRPNVIWFMVDQMRAQALSYAGDPNVHTPNLDRMARDGAYFPNACMGFPLCCPARASMVTGKYPHKTVPGHEFKLPPKTPTIADAFNQADYHTTWLGKWHLDGWHEKDGRAAWNKTQPEERGRFKTWIGYDNNNSQWDSWVHGHRGDQEVELYRLPGHETDALTDMLLEEIEAHRDEPFFQVCSVQPPHDPYSAPAQFAGRHNPATLTLRPNVPPVALVEEKARRELAGYYALIEHIDANVGRVMTKLESLGLSDHTYLMFFSDHGDQFGSHGYHRKMTPLEESIRVPLMIWGGERYRYREGVYYDVTNHVDMAPTTLGLCDLPVPEEMEGVDYGSVLRGREARSPFGEVPEEAYLQCVVPTQHAESMDLPWRGIVTRDGWKYVALEGQPLYLFDLNTDPYELVNLTYHAFARDKRLEMNTRLQRWIDRTDDTFSLPRFTSSGRPESTEAITEHFKNKALWVS